jgi:hypothetical protein
VEWGNLFGRRLIEGERCWKERRDVVDDNLKDKDRVLGHASGGVRRGRGSGSGRGRGRKGKGKGKGNRKGRGRGKRGRGAEWESYL